MKENYILIAYKPETYIRTCGCCPGETYEHDFQIHECLDLEELADVIATYAISNSETQEGVRGYEIWVICNGKLIVGEPDYCNGANPCKKMREVVDSKLDRDEISDDHIRAIEELDVLIDIKCKKDIEQKKERERLRKEREKEKERQEKLKREKLKEENEKKKLIELSKKYPELIK
jgi:hypothetical protein